MLNDLITRYTQWPVLFLSASPAASLPTYIFPLTRTIALPPLYVVCVLTPLNARGSCLGYLQKAMAT